MTDFYTFQFTSLTLPLTVEEKEFAYLQGIHPLQIPYRWDDERQLFSNTKKAAWTLKSSDDHVYRVGYIRSILPEVRRTILIPLPKELILLAGEELVCNAGSLCITKEEFLCNVKDEIVEYRY